MSALLRIMSCSGSFDLAAWPFSFPVKTITEGFFCHLSFSAHSSLFTFSQLPFVILSILAFLSQINWSWRAQGNKINLHSSVSIRSPTEGLGEADQRWTVETRGLRPWWEKQRAICPVACSDFCWLVPEAPADIAGGGTMQEKAEVVQSVWLKAGQMWINKRKQEKAKEKEEELKLARTSAYTIALF